MIASGQVKTDWTIDLSLLEGNAPPACLACLECVVRKLPFYPSDWVYAGEQFKIHLLGHLPVDCFYQKK